MIAMIHQPVMVQDLDLEMEVTRGMNVGKVEVFAWWGTYANFL